MDSSLGFAVPEHSNARHASVSETVSVSRKSPVAGRAATLSRTPKSEVRRTQISSAACATEWRNLEAELITGDSVLSELLLRSSKRQADCSLPNAKYVWVTVGDERVVRAAKIVGSIDEHVTFESREHEPPALVQRLVGHQASSTTAIRERPRGGLAPSALRRVQTYIDEHLSERVGNEALARIAALSPGHFNRAFMQSTGFSPHRYIMRLRVALATQLLKTTNRPLADIALDAGFADQSHFCRTYVTVTGETPSACRRAAAPNGFETRIGPRPESIDRNGRIEQTIRQTGNTRPMTCAMIKPYRGGGIDGGTKGDGSSLSRVVDCISPRGVLRATWARSLATERMMIRRKVEQALEMMRVYLVECVSHNDWGDHRADEMAQTIRAWLRQSSGELRQTIPERTSKLPRDVFRRAVRFVNENLDTKLKWEEIATAVGIDPFTFGRGFKQSARMTPHQYVIRCRLRRAMKLLARDELTLADVALEVGCSCQSHLTTLFRKHLGTTPGAFRVSAQPRGRYTPRLFATNGVPIGRRQSMSGSRSSLMAVGLQAP